MAEQLTNVDIVVFALASLSPTGGSIHLERIAGEAFNLTPGPFRWDLPEYSDRIDKDKVRVSLTDGQKAKYGSLVEAVAPKRAGVSKPTDAWRLTSAGVAWFVSNRERVAGALGRPRPALKRGKAQEIEHQIRSTGLFKRWRDLSSIEANPYLFADLVGCSPDARSQVVREKFDRLRGQVLLLQDEDLIRFLDSAAEANKEMLSTGGSA